MRFVFLIFSFTLALNAQAQWQTIKTSFWQSTAPEVLTLRLRALTSGVEDDCARFKNEYQAHSDWSAVEFDLFRRIPLKNSMKDHYEADFEITSNSQSYRDLPAEDLGSGDQFEANPHIYVETASISDLKAVGEAEFIKITENFGLQLEHPKIVKVPNSAKTRVRFFSREMVCDFLSTKVDLAASAEAELSLSGFMIERLNRFYEKIEKIYDLMTSEEEPDEIKAIKLGAAFGQMVYDQSDESHYEPQLSRLYERVFDSDTLARSANWQDFGGYSLIVFSKDAPVKNLKLILRGEK